MNDQLTQPENETTLDARKKTATVIAAVLLVTLVAFDIFSIYNYFSHPNIFLLFALLLSFAATASTMASTWLIRNGRVNTGVWGLILTNLIALFLSPFLGSGLGIIYGITGIVVTAVMSQALERKQAGRAMLISTGTSIATIFLDILLPANSNTNPTNNIFTYIILGLMIVALLIVVARQFAGYNLRNKLLVAFGVLFAFGMVIAASGIWGLNRVQNSYKNALTGGIEIQNHSDHLNSELLDARRREKDFLLNWKTEGYAAAYASYVAVNQDHTAEMKVSLQELDALAPVLDRNPLTGYSRVQYESDIDTMNKDLVIYEDAFSTAVELLGQRGFVDTGLEGEFRTAVQAIEARIYDRQGLEPLVITMLQIRRREKDYLLRGDQQYVDNVHELVTQLKNQVTASEALQTGEKTEIRTLADEYLVKFDALVAKDAEISAQLEALEAAAFNVQTIAVRLESIGEQLAKQDIGTAEGNGTQAFAITGTIVLFVLIISIVVALSLSRQLTRPIIALTKTAQEISDGNFNIQATVDSADEIGSLAQNFNIMTARLEQAFADVRRRASELATVAEVSTATSTILDVKSLLQEVVNLTKERFNLYHSHIYLLDEAGKNLVLASGAGEAGRQMVAEKRSIPLDREQSLVARAARDGKGVIVNDVTLASDFLPNPLLPNTRSELAVPMIVGGRLIGVFDVQSDVVGRFTESDINIQTTLAAQVSTSIQNVRSFEQSKTQADFEALINTIGQKIQRATTVEDTLQTAIREVGLALGATRVSANIQAQQES
jgi:HAMP domain-containing protein